MRIKHRNRRDRSSRIITSRLFSELLPVLVIGGMAAFAAATFLLFEREPEPRRVPEVTPEHQLSCQRTSAEREDLTYEECLTKKGHRLEE